MDTLNLILLGGFQARTASGAAIPIAAKKAKALLAYLALQPGECCSRNRLAALLWEEYSDTQALGSLRNALTSLRKALPAAELLITQGDMLAVAPAGIGVDVLDFERLVAEGTPDALAQAIERYQGEFLEGFNPRAPAFEDWLMARRSRLREQTLEALEALLEHYRAEQADERAVQVAIRLLTLDPLRESVQRSLMALYAKQGHYGAALKQYRTCQAVLRRELGLAPEPETERLYRDLVRQRHQPAGAVPASATESEHHRQGTLSATATGAPAVGQADSERRQVTVLVARLTETGDALGGFTPLDRQDLASQSWAAASWEIEHYGGLILERSQGLLSGVFGVPMARGNDTERAVRAADAIQRTFPGIGIGIASGRILVTVLEDTPRAGAIAGDVIATAQQLATQAIAGTTLLSDTAFSGVAARVLAEPLAEGSTATEKPVWRLRVLRDRLARSVFVGRRQELHQLATAIDACVETQGGRTFLIRGEAGIGKTRLLEEFITIAEGRGYAVHQTPIFDFGAATGREAVRTLVRRLLDLPPDDSAWQALALVERVLGDVFSAPEQQVFLNDLLDLPQPPVLAALCDAMDGATRRRGVRELLSWLIEALSRKRPLLLVVEDIHWADQETLGLLASIAATVADCPALLAMTSRVEGEPLDPEWRAAMQGAPLTTLDLGPLGEDEALALARELAGPGDDFARHCVERARGNPLFLEQLLRAGERDDGIPDSIQSLVWARLDRLAPTDKRAIQAAAVLGQCFTLLVLRHLIDEPSYRCTHLVEQRLLRPDAGQYLFAHALIMKGIYDSMLPEQRRAWHRRAAEWFREHDAILHAEHLERAEDPAAPLAYLAAARAQAQAYRYERALDLVRRGLLQAHDLPAEFELTCCHGELLHAMGLLDVAIEEFEHALTLPVAGSQRCRAWLGMAAAMRIQDRYTEALTVLDRAEHVADSAQTEELAQIYYYRGAILYTLARIDDCLRAHQRAFELAQKTTSPKLEALTLHGLGNAYYQRSHMITAHRYYDRCMRLCREYGFGRIEAETLCMRGLTSFYQNRLGPAQESIVEALNLVVTVGNKRAECLARAFLGYLLYYMADWQAAKRQAEQTLALSRHLGAKQHQASALNNLGNTLAALGNRSKAEQLFEQAYSLSCETGVAFLGPRILGFMALHTADAAKRRWALCEGEKILQQGCVGHNYLLFYQTAIEVALADKDWDGVERYAAALQDYTRPEPLPWSDFFIARGRALAAYGRGERDPRLVAELQRLREEAAQAGLKIALCALETAIAQHG